MRFAKLTSFALAGALTFAACKYEEGPKISLRAKRDRVANEWRVKAYTHKGEDKTSLVSNEETKFRIILNFYRNGSYGVEIVKEALDADNNVIYITNHTRFDTTNQKMSNGGLGFDACCFFEYKQFQADLPSHIRDIMFHGKWTFDRGHTKIQVKPELSYDNQEVMKQKNTIDWMIVLLKEKEMKVKGRDSNDDEWTLHLERINDEPYFY